MGGIRNEKNRGGEIMQDYKGRYISKEIKEANRNQEIVFSLEKEIREINEINKISDKNEKRDKMQKLRDSLIKQIYDLTNDAMDPINDKNGDKIIEYARKFAKLLYTDDRITVTKLRKIFNIIKSISKKDFDNNTIYQLNMFKAYLAYVSGKFKELKEVKFYDLLEPAVESAKRNKEIFNRFVNLFEAIIAYHRAYGAKE